MSLPQQQVSWEPRSFLPHGMPKMPFPKMPFTFLMGNFYSLEDPLQISAPLCSHPQLSQKEFIVSSLGLP